MSLHPSCALLSGVPSCALPIFILVEVGLSVVGTRGDLRSRRRILARTISHAGIKAALDKVRGSPVDASVVADFLRPSGSGAATGSAHAPAFARSLASAFADSQSKRHDADYAMNKQFSVAAARLLQSRVRNVIAHWRGDRARPAPAFKHTLCPLVL